MPLMDSSVPAARTLMTGLMFVESPRWRDGRFWVIAVDLEGKSEVVVREPSIPLCFDFMPDGRMVIMSGRRILRLEPDGSLAIHADLTSLCEFEPESKTASLAARFQKTGNQSQQGRSKPGYWRTRCDQQRNAIEKEDHLGANPEARRDPGVALRIIEKLQSSVL